MQKKHTALILFCFLIFCSSVVFSKADEAKYRLVFSEFDVSSAGDYAYLRGGIQSMIVSRLAAKDQVEVLDHSLGAKELKALKTKDVNVPAGNDVEMADYLVSGSLYALKDGLNIQVVLYPFKHEKETLRYEVLVKHPETMLAEVEKFAHEIAQVAFGAKNVVPGLSTNPSVVSGVSGFVTVHPEAAYKKSLHTGLVVGAADGRVKVSAKEGKKTLSLAKEIRTLTVGDVDGDGEDEIVILLGRDIEIYKIDGKQIIKKGSGNLPAGVECHALNLADLDGDGKSEFYFSSTSGLDVASLILGWQGAKGFHIIAENIPWYIRPVLLPGKKWQLVGQKRGAGKADFIKPGLFSLKMNGKQGVSEGERLPLPTGVNLFDFVFADIDNDGAAEIVSIDKKERMKVYNRENELLWVSKKTFGGSLNYIGPSRASAVNDHDRKNLTMDEDIERELIFVPGRLVVTDVDHDGRQEIVVNENSLSYLSIFDKIRIYDDGMIVGLSWDGSAMNEMWRSGTFRGYIAGFGFSTLNQSDNSTKVGVQSETRTSVNLFVGHLPKSGTLVGLLPGTGETQMTAYELEFSSEKTK